MDGVNLTLKPTKKFKTNQILVSFTTNIKNHQEITARTLLADLLESTSEHYSTQRAVALKLSELYGASFGTSVSRYGNVYGLNFIINVVNDQYLPGTTNVLQETFAFLNEMIFSPQIVDGKFAADAFQIQKQNLEAFLTSLDDNKQGKALTGMNALYFHDRLQQIPAVGQIADIGGLSAANMAALYHKMITEDQINIVVSGHVKEDEVVSALKVMPFTARKKKHLSLIYTQARSPQVKNKSEKEKVSQSKLNLAYNLPIAYDSQERFSAMVFNELFGGSALSLLFQNVREKTVLLIMPKAIWICFGRSFGCKPGSKLRTRIKFCRSLSSNWLPCRRGKLIKSS
jgi:Predicted Zn-dependent peptidases